MYFLNQLTTGYSYISDDMKIPFILIAVLIFILGTITGGLIIRLYNKSGLYPLSNTRLKQIDLIPIINRFIHKGKRRLPLCYILVELITGISFCLAFIVIGINIKFIITILLFTLLIILSVVDIYKMVIPYWCNGSIAILGIICFIVSFFKPDLFGFFWYEHLIGAVIIALPFALLSYLGAMGGGDVQLVAAAGLLLGWAIVPSTMIALLTGSLIGLIIKVFKKKSRISFGPFLSFGIASGMLWGNDILHWYLSVINI